MREITPRHLQCGAGYCPAVYEMKDGNLLIVGKKPSTQATNEIQDRVGDDECAVVISPDYFKGNIK